MRSFFARMENFSSAYLRIFYTGGHLSNILVRGNSIYIGRRNLVSKVTGTIYYSLNPLCADLFNTLYEISAIYYSCVFSLIIYRSKKLVWNIFQFIHASLQFLIFKIVFSYTYFNIKELWTSSFMKVYDLKIWILKDFPDMKLLLLCNFSVILTKNPY